MSKIFLKWFGGMRPRLGDQHLSKRRLTETGIFSQPPQNPDFEMLNEIPATEAENCNLYSGELRPLRQPALAHRFCKPTDDCWRQPIPDDPSVPPVEPPEPPDCVPVVIDYDCDTVLQCEAYEVAVLENINPYTYQVWELPLDDPGSISTVPELGTSPDTVISRNPQDAGSAAFLNCDGPVLAPKPGSNQRLQSGTARPAFWDAGNEISLLEDCSVGMLYYQNTSQSPILMSPDPGFNWAYQIRLETSIDNLQVRSLSAWPDKFHTQNVALPDLSTRLYDAGGNPIWVTLVLYIKRDAVNQTHHVKFWIDGELLCDDIADFSASGNPPFWVDSAEYGSEDLPKIMTIKGDGPFSESAAGSIRCDHIWMIPGMVSQSQIDTLQVAFEENQKTSVPPTEILLMHMDEKPFIDSSAAGNVITETKYSSGGGGGSGQGVILNTTNPLYGVGAAEFKGQDFVGGYGRLNVPNDLFDLAYYDFTIELSVYIPTADYAVNGQGYLCRRSGGATGWTLDAASGGGLRFRAKIDEVWSDSVVTVPNGSILADTWTPIALTREDGTWRLFVGGVLLGEETNSGPLDDQPYDVNIGCASSNFENRANCLMDELRFTKGQALYTENYTPATGPFTPAVPSVIDPETILTGLCTLAFDPPIPDPAPIGFQTSITIPINADATVPVQYQWYRNNIAIPGEVGPVLNLTLTEADSFASYTALVQNPCSSQLTFPLVVPEVGFVCEEWQCDAIETALLSIGVDAAWSFVLDGGSNTLAVQIDITGGGTHLVASGGTQEVINGITPCVGTDCAAYQPFGGGSGGAKWNAQGTTIADAAFRNDCSFGGWYRMNVNSAVDLPIIEFGSSRAVGLQLDADDGTVRFLFFNDNIGNWDVVDHGAIWPAFNSGGQDTWVSVVAHFNSSGGTITTWIEIDGVRSSLSKAGVATLSVQDRLNLLSSNRDGESSVGLAAVYPWVMAGEIPQASIDALYDAYDRNYSDWLDADPLCHPCKEYECDALSVAILATSPNFYYPMNIQSDIDLYPTEANAIKDYSGSGNHLRKTGGSPVGLASSLEIDTCDGVMTGSALNDFNLLRTDQGDTFLGDVTSSDSFSVFMQAGSYGIGDKRYTDFKWPNTSGYDNGLEMVYYTPAGSIRVTVFNSNQFNTGAARSIDFDFGLIDPDYTTGIIGVIVYPDPNDANRLVADFYLNFVKVGGPTQVPLVNGQTTQSLAPDRDVDRLYVCSDQAASQEAAIWLRHLSDGEIEDLRLAWEQNKIGYIDPNDVCIPVPA